MINRNVKQGPQYVDELKKIAPVLRVDGMTVVVPPETTLVTLTKTVMEEQLHPASPIEYV
jgi:hypothetical protein